MPNTYFLSRENFSNLSNKEHSVNEAALSKSGNTMKEFWDMCLVYSTNTSKFEQWLTENNYLNLKVICFTCGNNDQNALEQINVPKKIEIFYKNFLPSCIRILEKAKKSGILYNASDFNETEDIDSTWYDGLRTSVMNVVNQTGDLVVGTLLSSVIDLFKNNTKQNIQRDASANWSQFKTALKNIGGHNTYPGYNGANILSKLYAEAKAGNVNKTSFIEWKKYIDILTSTEEYFQVDFVVDNIVNKEQEWNKVAKFIGSSVLFALNVLPTARVLGGAAKFGERWAVKTLAKAVIGNTTPEVQLAGLGSKLASKITRFKAVRRSLMSSKYAPKFLSKKYKSIFGDKHGLSEFENILTSEKNPETVLKNLTKKYFRSPAGQKGQARYERDFLKTVLEEEKIYFTDLTTKYSEYVAQFANKENGKVFSHIKGLVRYVAGAPLGNSLNLVLTIPQRLIFNKFLTKVFLAGGAYAAYHTLMPEKDREELAKSLPSLSEYLEGLKQNLSGEEELKPENFDAAQRGIMDIITDYAKHFSSGENIKTALRFLCTFAESNLDEELEAKKTELLEEKNIEPSEFTLKLKCAIFGCIIAVNKEFPDYIYSPDMKKTSSKFGIDLNKPIEDEITKFTQDLNKETEAVLDKMAENLKEQIAPYVSTEAEIQEMKTKSETKIHNLEEILKMSDLNTKTKRREFKKEARNIISGITSTNVENVNDVLNTIR